MESPRGGGTEKLSGPECLEGEIFSFKGHFLPTEADFAVEGLSGGRARPFSKFFQRKTLGRGLRASADGHGLCEGVGSVRSPCGSVKRFSAVRALRRRKVLKTHDFSRHFSS